jgi:protease I
MFGFGKKKQLKRKQARVAILIADGVEQAHLDASIKALRRAEAETFIISLRPGKVQTLHGLKRGAKVPVDITIDEVHPASFAALLLPGGATSADRLRLNQRALEFVRAFDRNRKPIAAIGHATWILASAGVLRKEGFGRKLTSWPGIKDDVVNSGGVWLDEPYVLDENLLTSRTAQDLRPFTKQLIKLFAERAEDSAGTLIEAQA